MAVWKSTLAAAVVGASTVAAAVPRNLGGRAAVPGVRYTFAWPYAADGRCVCEVASWGEFATEEECLAAFAAYPSETCHHGGSAIDAKECQWAVSRVFGRKNSQCRTLCEESLGSSEDWEAFLLQCSLEKIKRVSNTVRSMGTCFSNDIHGHSDASYKWDEAENMEIGYLEVANVQSAVACQELCQEDAACESWFWRQLPDGLGRDPLTCFLKDSRMVEFAASAVIPVGSIARGQVPSIDTLDGLVWRYCDLESKWESMKDSYSGDTEYCNCGCVWKSDNHMSGPRYCPPGEAQRNLWGVSLHPQHRFVHEVRQ